MSMPYKFKVKIKQKRTHDRKCLKCGKYSYPNYFYCIKCHHKINDTVESQHTISQHKTPSRGIQA